MPYPPHYRLQMSGTHFATEIWSMSLNLVSTAPTWVTSDFEGFARDNVQAAAEAVSAWWTLPSAHISPAAKLTSVKFNWIGPDGRQTDQTGTNEWTFNHTPVSAPQQGSGAPPQVCVALSMRTARARGPASHGRIFCPVQYQPLANDDPHLPPAMVSEMTSSFRAFINNLNDWPGIDPVNSGTVAVVSPLGTGHAEKVTAIAVGNVYDTQRRRRNGIAEAYNLQTLA
jgi:hypothetical protein